MQHEHVAAAFGRSAAKFMMLGMEPQCLAMLKLTENALLMEVLAEALTWALNDEEINDMISERVVAEAKRKR